MDLQGKVALVTGGAVRVGRAIALALADAGADIVLNYHTSETAAEVIADDIRARGVQALPYQADVAQVDQAQAMVAAAVERFGRLDVLVNSASLFRRTPVASVDETTWDQVLDIILKGAFFTAQAAIPHLAAHHDGLIVNIVDLSAFKPLPNMLAHSVAKAGLLNMTYALAMELAPDVRVNAIAPGLILPPPGHSPERIAALARRTLLGRWGSPEDVAQAVVYLGRAGFMTGAVIRVDGGEMLGPG